MADFKFEFQNEVRDLGTKISDLSHSIGALQLEVRHHKPLSPIREIAIDSLVRLNEELMKCLHRYRELVK